MRPSHEPGDDDRVVLVSGAYPPDVCGVGDYTERLAAAAPPSWRTFIHRDWSIRATLDILSRLLALRPSTVVLQYPTQGYGRSLLPHLLVAFGRLARRYRSVLALHEFSSLTLKGRVPLALAARFADHLVFTTEIERDRAHAFRLFPLRVPTSIIAVLSNIPAAPHAPPIADRRIDCAYFGHIRPNKGLEDFLTVMATLRSVDPAKTIAVIGQVPAGYEAFAELVIARCRALGCELILDLDDRAVAEQLADVKLLYLPFPDGVSARRGSVLAGLANGALVAARVGAATPEPMRSFLIECSGGPGDADILQRTLALGAAEQANLQEAGRHYLRQVLPPDWGHVAALYDAAVRSANSSPRAPRRG